MSATSSRRFSIGCFSPTGATSADIAFSCFDGKLRLQLRCKIGRYRGTTKAPLNWPLCQHLKAFVALLIPLRFPGPTGMFDLSLVAIRKYDVTGFKPRGPATLTLKMSREQRKRRLRRSGRSEAKGE